MFGRMIMDRLRNEYIREKIALRLSSKIDVGLRWYGHVHRRPIEDSVRRCETVTSTRINRRRGSQKKTWIITTRHDTHYLNIDEDII